MRHIILLSFISLFSFISLASAQVESVTVSGAPIATKHIQTGEESFRERHGLAIAKVHTKDYGNWGVYFLNPNSVDRTSFGAGYVTDPYVIPVGPTQLEFSAALGLVTGYEDYPLPLIAGEINWILYQQGAWNAGLGMAALPYITNDDVRGGTDWGIVGTSPFLTIRYRFNP